MKSGSFGLLLRAFAEVLNTAGARDAGGQILTLAGLFDIQPKTNVSEIVKRITSIDCSPSSRRPSAGDAARFLPSFRQLLEIAKSGGAADVDAIEALLRNRGSTELGALVRNSIELLAAKPKQTKARSKGKTPAPPLREDLVNDYQKRLESHLADKDRFAADYGELCSNEAMGKAEAIALAKRMTGTSSRLKDAALKKIWSRHQSLMASIAKSKATGGRSAA